MAIKIAHCPDHGATKTVVAAGADISAASHTHSDGTEHTCTLISEASESQPITYPYTTADGSVVHGPNEWLSYLEKYIP